ncbi:MAG: helix-turn-helix transcriptional regulator, partial [Clostridia bacterium]|nr:helix-turn-helix transcriptional regulator [Clostridia bacterium]
MLGEKIRNLRKENKISQEALAEKLDVSRQSISLWENDQTMPSMENIVAIANIFGVSTDTLLKEETENDMDEKTEESINTKKPLKKKLFVILSIILTLAIIGV